MTPVARTVSDRAFAIDAAAVAAASLAICAFGHRLELMTWIVPALIGLRCVLWLALPRGERDLDGRAELPFLAAATLLGALNDWNSVTRHGIYDYTVPTDLPGASAIPIWMLLTWGLILRFFSTAFHWRRAGIGRAADALWWGRRPLHRPRLRVAVSLALVLVTRQAIYRLFADPLWSWLPFLLALAALVLLLRPDAARLRMLAVVTCVGPLVEALYIHVGHLHVYHLGWLLGVPLWIALWWGLATLIWDDLATRAMDLLERALAPARAAA